MCDSPSLCCRITWMIEIWTHRVYITWLYQKKMKNVKKGKTKQEYFFDHLHILLHWNTQTLFIYCWHGNNNNNNKNWKPLATVSDLVCSASLPNSTWCQSSAYAFSSMLRKLTGRDKSFLYKLLNARYKLIHWQLYLQRK